MLTTAQTVVEDAYGYIGIYDGTSALQPREYTTALRLLNDMIDRWGQIQLMVYSETATQFNFVNGYQFYQLGSVNPISNATLTGSTLYAPGLTYQQGAQLVGTGLPVNTFLTANLGSGQFTVSQSAPTPLTGLTVDTCTFSPGGAPYGQGCVQWAFPRPSRLSRMSVLYVPGQNALELPIPIVDLERWQAIPMKNTQSGNFPLMVYNDESFPNMNLSFWPVPTGSSGAVCYSWNTLGELNSLSNIIELPPGYVDAFKYNLALRLALTNGMTPDPWLVTEAKLSRQDIDDINLKTPALHLDPLFAGRCRSNGIDIASRGFVVL